IFTFLKEEAVSPQQVLFNILWGTAESAIILCLMYYLGKRVIPLVFNKISHASRELLNLFIILMIFFIAYISTVFQVPVFVATFVAGVLVSQTLEHYHIFSQMRPLRDLMAIIFFVYIGAHIPLNSIVGIFPKILL